MAASILLVFVLIYFMMRWPTEAQERIGCFMFNHGNTVLSAEDKDPVMSIEECTQSCKTRGATYAGVRYSYQCYCGDSHNHTVNGEQLDDSSCTTTCNDRTRRCGGQFSIVIYSVCRRGRYLDSTTAEPNCDALCNCKDNHICLYNTGSCPDNCTAGWSGEACDVRVVQLTTEAATSLAIDNWVTDSGQSDTHDPPVKAIAVGVSLAALSLIVVAALIVYFRRRRSDRQSYDGDNETKSIPATDTSTQANADPSMKQTESGPTTTSTTPPMLNYSTVDFSNNGPVHISGEDITKSDDDVVIHGQHEKVEYAVVRKPADTTHANLKENSLYGAYNGDSDEEKVE